MTFRFCVHTQYWHCRTIIHKRLTEFLLLYICVHAYWLLPWSLHAKVFEADSLARRVWRHSKEVSNGLLSVGQSDNDHQLSYLYSLKAFTKMVTLILNPMYRELKMDVKKHTNIQSMKDTNRWAFRDEEQVDGVQIQKKGK